MIGLDPLARGVAACQGLRRTCKWLHRSIECRQACQCRAPRRDKKHNLTLCSCTNLCAQMVSWFLAEPLPNRSQIPRLCAQTTSVVGRDHSSERSFLEERYRLERRRSADRCKQTSILGSIHPRMLSSLPTFPLAHIFFAISPLSRLCPIPRV